jgi:xanthine dehydrogenase large subunit
MSKRKDNLKELIKGTMPFNGESESFTNYLFSYPIFSPQPKGKIVNIDFSPCFCIEGYIRGITASDIPGINAQGAVDRLEEPLLAEKEVNYIGQPIALVVATSQDAAIKAARKVKIEIDVDENYIVDLDQAIEKKSFYQEPMVVSCGDYLKNYDNSKYKIEGTFESGGQEHAYIETHRAYASYDSFRKNIIIKCGTQAISDVQQVTALALGKKENEIEVDVYRVGGAFGGKERGGTSYSALAALALYVTNRPCALILDRSDDLKFTGKRHPYKTFYKVGFDESGKITSFMTDLYANGGFYEDFTIAIVERAVLGICNSYYLENAWIRGNSCKTNLPPNTAFRGFGAPQATLVMEEIIYQIASKLNKTTLEIQKINFLKDGQRAPYGMLMEEVKVPQIVDQLLIDSNYEQLVKEKDKYNREHKYSKKGIGLVPVKYGIGFTATFLNQGNALINIFSDGSISVSHGGIEMGQGLFTKVELIVAKTLGVSPQRVKCESTNSHRVGTVASTAASTGTDLNGAAARMAATDLLENLKEAASNIFKDKINLAKAPQYIRIENDKVFDIRSKSETISFEELVSYCYFNRVKLGAQAHYATPGLEYDMERGKGTPFSYFTNGAALAMVQIDTLTGTYKVEKVHIRHEGGTILDEQIDRGQIIGGFVQGMGYVTMEELPHGKKGEQLASSFATYKVPLIDDVPEDLVVDLVPCDDKICGVLGNKGVGEPPLLYGIAVFNAIRDAITAKRDKPIYLNHPATAENVLKTLNK